MTKIIARATNDKGQVVELRATSMTTREIRIDGYKQGHSVTVLNGWYLFGRACAVEKDHE